MLDDIKHYYNTAMHTLLLAQDNLTRKWYHIFSVIELLPPDIPPYDIPNKGWHENTVRAVNSSKSDSYTFYLTVNQLNSVDDALTLFENPIVNTKIAKENIQYFNTAFVAEPGGKFPLVFSSNIYSDSGLESVLPKRNSGLYAWTKIDHQRVVQKQFDATNATKEMQAMSQLTTDWLGFDIWTQPEHIGNVYLCCPNPYFRDIDITLSHAPVGIFYNIKLRNAVAADFSFRIIDKHGDAVALDRLFPINDYIGLLELPHEPHLFHLSIYDNYGNLIAFQRPATFLKSISIEMSINQPTLHLTHKSAQDEETHIIQKQAPVDKVVVGKAPDFNAEYYFKNAENQRKYIDHKKNSEFVFFPGGKTPSEKEQLKSSAKNTLRELINRSRETCYLCDPYFNSKDLIEYAFYIKNSNVTLRILNSKQFLSKEEAKNIKGVLETYNSNPYGKIEVRTLRGDSILHDRFLIADKNVWFVGSSFNEFGNRATAIVKVPESSDIQIIKEIEKWYFDSSFSDSIEDYANA